LLVDAFERIRALLRGVSADAGGGESRSGSASRGDSLIEFVKTNVVILPLLIFTATTGSDELSYGLNDTAVDGFWIGSNWESTGEAPLADTLASIMDSAPYDGAAACAEEGRVINCKRSWIGRPGAENPARSGVPRTPRKVPRRCARMTGLYALVIKAGR
jgi:hypothetical protein